MTKQVIASLYPSFQIDFIVNVVDGKNQNADNINMGVYNVKAIHFEHDIRPDGDDKLFVSLMNRFAYGINSYLKDNIQVFGLGFSNYILTHYETVFTKVEGSSILICGKNS